MIACSTRGQSPPVCEPCSRAVTGRDAVWVGRYWSRVNARLTKRATSLVLGATLPGEPLYRAFGLREVERLTLTMPDGVSLEAVAMERPIEAG
jgi:hypothetical protein